MFSGIMVFFTNIILVVLIMCLEKKHEKSIDFRYERKLFGIANGLVLVIEPVICRKSDYNMVVLFCFVLMILRILLRVCFEKRIQESGVFYGALKSEFNEELWLLAAAALLAVSTKLEPFFYMMPLLITLFSGSGSKIVGSQYGTICLNRMDEKRKTLLEFFTFCCSCYLILLGFFLCYDHFIKTDSILAAFLFSGSLAVAHLVSMSGMENFIVPLSAYLYLQVYADGRLKLTLWGAVSIMIVLAMLFMLVLTSRQKVTPLSIVLLSNVCFISFLCGGLYYMLLVMIIWYFMFLASAFVSGKKQRAQLSDFEEFQVMVLISLMAVQNGISKSCGMNSLLVCFSICLLIKRAIIQRGKVYEM